MVNKLQMLGKDSALLDDLALVNTKSLSFKITKEITIMKQESNGNKTYAYTAIGAATALTAIFALGGSK